MLAEQAEITEDLMSNRMTTPSEFLIAVSVVIIVGCSAAGPMSDPQKRYQQNVSNKVLIHMDIKTLFPSEDLRKLADAAGKGKTLVIDRLINEGVDVNARGTENATALFWSMRNERGFNYLLAKGADPNVVFGDGGSVLHWAARKQNCAMLASALKHGGNPNLSAGMFGGSPAFATISIGIENGIPECLKLLLSNNADLEFRDKRGKTLLLFAAGLARFDIASFLLDKGADPTVTDIDGKNVIAILASYQNAFNPGSTTETNWTKLKQQLENLGVN